MRSSSDKLAPGRAATALAALAALAGCTSHYPINAPVHELPAEAAAYTAANPQVGGRPDGFVMALALSGGGTRAATFAYGVMEALAETEVHVNGEQVRLLDQVDVISSVSGSSFTAAYYGLFGDRLFEDFEDRFLRRNVERALVLRAMSPASWPRLISSRYGRSELAAELFDEILFEGRTYRDVARQPRPLILINATDLESGSLFSFEQSSFDLLCSDLLDFRVSRAVMASAAVPVVFTPIVVQNHAGTCDYTRPAWASRALERRDAGDRRYETAEVERLMLDSTERPYLHLVDGALADFLGIRALLDAVEWRGGMEEALAQSGERGAAKLVVIIVNAWARPHPLSTDSDSHLPTSQVVVASSTIPLQRYSFETVSDLRDSLERWRAEVRRQRSTPEFDIYLIEVDPDSIPDEAEREYVLTLPTSFSLAADATDRLRRAAHEALHASAEFQRLITDLK